MQSPTFYVTESDPRFNQQKQLTVTEAGRALKVETDLPHLVSLGSGRFSTAVTLHPLPEGKTTVGCMNADIIIRGRGIQPEHCYFIHDRDVVILFPISNMITVDGAKVTRPTILSQGSMICFGRSNYFRFNHPAEAQHLKEEYFDIYNDIYSTADVFSKREPLYANEEISNSSATSTTEDSLSIPLYDNVNEVKSSYDKKIPNGGCPPLPTQDYMPTFSGYHDDFRNCSPVSPFHSDIGPYSIFSDGSLRPQRAIENRYVGMDNMMAPDFFDERASHIPRPISPLVEGLTIDNWSGYDNILELKESIKKLQKEEAERSSEPTDRSSSDKHSLSEVNFPIKNIYTQVESVSRSSEETLHKKTPPPSPDAITNVPRRTTESPKLDADLILKKQSLELLDRRRVTFNIKEEKGLCGASVLVTNDVTPIDASSKPPSGKQNFEQLKKQENKKEKKFLWGKKSLSGSATDSGGETPPTRPSFFRSLMRSRSPSPTKRSPSPVSLKCPDVARRLSEPLKKSFKNPDPSIREKFFGKKVLEGKDESSSSEDEGINDSKASFLVSSSVSDNITRPNSTDNNSTSNKNPLETKPSHSLCSSIIDKHNVSVDRVVNIRNINTTDDEKCRSSLLVEQQPIICNPWKVNLKSCNVNISFDNYKGEKLFARDTVTTSISMPRVSATHNSNLNCNITNSIDTTNVSGKPKDLTVAKPPVDTLPRSSSAADSSGNPIYDCVYDGRKPMMLLLNDVTDHDKHLPTPGSNERHFSEDVLEFLDKIVSSNSMFTPSSAAVDEAGGAQDVQDRDALSTDANINDSNNNDTKETPSSNKDSNLSLGKTTHNATNIPETSTHPGGGDAFVNDNNKVSKTSIQLRVPKVYSHKDDSEVTDVPVSTHSTLTLVSGVGSTVAKTHLSSSVETTRLSPSIKTTGTFLATGNASKHSIHGSPSNLSTTKYSNDNSIDRKPSPTVSFKEDHSATSTLKSSIFNGSGSIRYEHGDTISGKPPLCEQNKPVDEEIAALFGVRRGVLYRMKMLKQTIEEIEDKEKNIENLISRNSMSIDVLEKKQISEKDIKEFFSNAANTLSSLDEEGKKIESQFLEANEYLSHINKTIGEMEKKKKHQVFRKGDHTTVSGSSPPGRNLHVASASSSQDSVLSRSAYMRKSVRDNHLTLTDVKGSSGSSDTSSIFGSATLLDKSANKVNKDPSLGSSTIFDKSTPIPFPRNSTCRPLTRYFPVTDSSFNLRLYVESSGHNLDVCKAVTLESFRCSGYLSKMGRKWKKWHRRWFVFDRTKRHLACYLDEPQVSAKHQQQPRSAYYFQSIRDVFADHLHMVKSPNPDFTFCVKLVDKNLFLMASSADAMRIWIDVLFTGAEAYQDVS